MNYFILNVICCLHCPSFLNLFLVNSCLYLEISFVFFGIAICVVSTCITLLKPLLVLTIIGLVPPIRIAHFVLMILPPFNCHVDFRQSFCRTYYSSFSTTSNSYSSTKFINLIFCFFCGLQNIWIIALIRKCLSSWSVCFF